MPIRIVRGDLFASGADVLVNPVNCVGVQGAGLARQFRDRFPELDAEYRAACRSGLLRLGNPVLSEDGRVLWFPTKQHYQDCSRIAPITAGLVTLVERWGQDPDRSWAFPALGCGLGGLSWDEVRPIMERWLGQMRGEVLMYEP